MGIQGQKMNKRTQQLAEQAGMYVDLYGKPWPKSMSAEECEAAYQKFAELIVAECMQQVEEQYKPVLEDETMMKDTHWDGYVQCGVDSYVAIREHFYGVEE
jgi:hypothetical protein